MIVLVCCRSLLITFMRLTCLLFPVCHTCAWSPVDLSPCASCFMGLLPDPFVIWSMFVPSSSLSLVFSFWFSCLVVLDQEQLCAARAQVEAWSASVGSPEWKVLERPERPSDDVHELQNMFELLQHQLMPWSDHIRRSVTRWNPRQVLRVSTYIQLKTGPGGLCWYIVVLMTSQLHQP